MSVLKNKTVVITGASRGLGRHIAQQLAQAGCRLILLARNREQLASLQHALQQAGHEVDIIACDLGQTDSLKAAIETLLQHPRPIDILINNAGTGWYKEFLEHSPEEHDQIINTNFRAVVHLTQALLPGMLQQESGHIVNIGSDLSQRPLAKMAVYVASKHALRGFSRSLLREVKHKGVRVSLVNPGIIDTHFDNSVEGKREASWSLRPADLAQLVVTVLSQPGYQLIDEVDVHPLMQDF
jgi:short-subunit dehydrogenase